MNTVEALYAQALLLSERERIDLADRLYESLLPPPPGSEAEEASPEEIEAAWAEEARARLAAWERGEVQGIPLDEAVAELRAKLLARRAADPA